MGARRGVRPGATGWHGPALPGRGGAGLSSTAELRSTVPPSTGSLPGDVPAPRASAWGPMLHAPPGTAQGQGHTVGLCTIRRGHYNADPARRPRAWVLSPRAVAVPAPALLVVRWRSEAEPVSGWEPRECPPE